MEYEFIEYVSDGKCNTIAKIGKNKILYPSNINWGMCLFYIEVEDFGNWYDFIDSFISVKHTSHMDYLFINTVDKLFVLKATNWDHPKSSGTYTIKNRSEALT